MNLNVKLNADTIKVIAKKLAKSLGIIAVLVAGGFVIYTGYFLTNLLYSTGDTTTAEKKQTDSASAKQIRFNEKTLQSLDNLTPARTAPNTEDVGKEDPFAPN